MSHMLRDIAVFFDATEAGQRILEIAAKLAGEQEAHLVGICCAEPEGSLPPDDFARGRAMADVIRRHDASTAARFLRAGQCLAQAAEACGGRAEFRAIPYAGSSEDIARHSLHCDLLIAGYPSAPGAPRSWAPSKIIQQTGVALMLIPDEWSGRGVGRRITVAWNGSRQARRAIADSLPLLLAAQSVDLLVVEPDTRSALYGEAPGGDMAAYLVRHGVQVELRQVSSQGQAIADTILAHARERDCDLIVFGAYSRARLSEALLGGVTRTLLAEVPVPLFVTH